MNETKIKICGITRAEDARLASELGAWAIGMIFHKGSQRCVTTATAKEIAKIIPKDVLRVGVFVDATLEEIDKTDDEINFDLIQLHGNETNEFCEKVGANRVIRAAVMTDTGKAGKYLLLDRPRTKDISVGAPLDHDQARKIIMSRPQTILAGGLTADNVYNAVVATRPFGVDVASGVEMSPGVKDAAKLKSFFTAVRRADQEK